MSKGIKVARIGSMAVIVLALAACESAPMPDGGGSDAGGGLCARSADCDDGRFCNGVESCDPSASAADDRGCVAAAPPCAGAEVCDEVTNACVTCAETSDGDGDGEDSPACGGADCDDTDPDRFPGNVEVCDGDDEDCDDRTIGVRDADGDGETAAACCNPDDGPGAPLCGTDCDDGTLTRREMQPEYCDSVDNDCNGIPDDMTVEVAWYVDEDGDGFGAIGSAPTMSCTPIPGRSLVSSDCDDGDPGVSRVGVEVCDGRDQDCDGTIDDVAGGCADAGTAPDMDGGTCGAIGTSCCAAGVLPGDPDGDGCAGDAYGHGCRGGTCVACAASAGVTGRCEDRDLVTECSVASAGTVPAGCRNGGGGYVATCCPGSLVDADGDGVHDWIDCDPANAVIGACFEGADAGPPTDGGRVGVDSGAPGVDAGPPVGEAYAPCDVAVGCADPLFCVGGSLRGVCTEWCSTAATCPAGDGVICSGGYCLESCTSTADCRAGTYCAPASLVGVEACLPIEPPRSCAVPLVRAGGSELAFPDAGGCVLRAETAEYIEIALSFSYGMFPQIGTYVGRLLSVSPRLPGDAGVPAGVPIAVRLELRGNVYDIMVRIDGVASAYTVTILSVSLCDPSGAPSPYYDDVDGDGAGSGPAVGTAVCGPPPGRSSRNDDCDEFAADNSPGFFEMCDGFDNDCSGSADEDSAATMCPARPHGVMACSAGSCSLSLCASSYASCEGSADPSGNGCETGIGLDDEHHCGGCRVGCAGVCSAGTCAAPDSPFVDLEHGEGRICAIRASSEVACWAHLVTTGAGETLFADLPLPAAGIAGALEVAAGYEHVCARIAGGRVSCLGRGPQVGVAPVAGAYAPIESATEVAGIADAVELAAGNSTTCVRRATGQVLCWGSGPLGTTSGGETHVPTPVAGISDAISIDVHGLNACAVRTGGTVVCWGANDTGQVGDGTTMPRSTPRTVTGVAGAARVQVGPSSACAILTDGTVRCWGDDSEGQLGDGVARPGPSTAVTVIGLSAAAEVVPTVFHTPFGMRVPELGGPAGCARTTAGRIFCWGGSSSAPITATEQTAYGTVADFDGSCWIYAGSSIVECDITPDRAGDEDRSDGIVRHGASGYCLFGLDACASDAAMCYRWSGALSCTAPASSIVEGADAPDDPTSVTTFRAGPVRVNGAIASTFDRDCYGVSVPAGGVATISVPGCDSRAPATAYVTIDRATGESLTGGACREIATNLAAGDYVVCIGQNWGGGGGGWVGPYEILAGGSAP